MNEKDFIRVVNQEFDLVMLLRAMDIPVHMVPATLRCPFHEDNSKSAKLFEDNRMFCWTCHKQFGAYDALQVLGVSDSEIKRQLSQKGVVLLEKDKEFTVDEEAAKTLKTQFRLKKIPMRGMLDGLYTLIEAGEAQG